MTTESDRQPVLYVDRLSRFVSGKPVVSEVSFEVRRRQTLAIVGPSGAGKSSLLRLLNRLDEPTAGTVFLEGEDYRAIRPHELRRRVGMVMQTAFLFPGTVADNVRFGPRQYGRDLADDDIDRLLNQVGLQGFRDRTVERLSGGEAQRVSVARTLANAPVVLLADEPTSALDDASKLGIEALFADLERHGGLTCVIVTHDMAQARRMAGRSLVMEASRMVRIGPTEEVLHAERA